MSTKLEEFDRIFAFHTPNEEQIEKHRAIRDKARRFAHLIQETTPASREQSIAFTKLEEVVMWANAAISRWPEFNVSVKDS